MQSIISYIKLKDSNANVQNDAKDEENQQPVQLIIAYNKSQQFVKSLTM